MNAQVAVFGFTVSPASYTYTIPDGLDLQVGQIVEVPFGKKVRRGVVTEISRDAPAEMTLKPITKILSPGPLIKPQQLQLARFISDHYFIPLAEAIELMLPRIPRTQPTQESQATQELFIFPTLRQAERAGSRGDGVAFSHTLKAHEFDDSWGAISSGKATHIFGTRTALFAPFHNLKRICIFQTESDVYKEERRPYYRAIVIAKKLAAIWGVKLEAVSYSPRVQDEFTVRHSIKNLPAQKIEIVDLRHQPILNDGIKENLMRLSGKKILVFLNRKSEKGPLQCRTCKEVTYTSDPSVCPNCGGADVRFQTFNLQTVAKKITTPPGSRVTFATQQILFEDHDPFDLVVVLSIDTFLNRPNFNSSEKTFQMTTSLRRLLKPQGQLVIQTRFPDEPAIRLAVAGDYLKFYREELKLRQETGNPPFSQIAKVTATGKETNLPPLSSLEVFGPFSGKKPYFIVRGKDLAPLRDLPRSWKLDIDPLSI